MKLLRNELKYLDSKLVWQILYTETGMYFAPQNKIIVKINGATVTDVLSTDTYTMILPSRLYLQYLTHHIALQYIKKKCTQK
jgi:hypothetical protein